MSRVSNKQVLDAIQAMPAAIAAALSNSTIDRAVSEAEAVPATVPGKVSVDAAYLGHVTAKLQGRSNNDGKTYALYARTNVAGETKLAYCEARKFGTLTDRRIIGAVATISPE